MESSFNFNSPNNLPRSTINTNEKNLIFFNELKTLMYGFGDLENPENETVELLEQYLIEYVQNIALLAFKRSKRRGFNEIKLKDLLYIIKNDKKKFYRVPSLLSFYELLKK